MKIRKRGVRISISGRAAFFNQLSGCVSGFAPLSRRRAGAVCTLIDMKAGRRALLIGKETDALKKAAQKRGCGVTVCGDFSFANESARYDDVILFETAADAEKAAGLLTTGGRLTVCALCGRYQANRLGGRLVSAKALAGRLAESYTVDVCVDTPTLFVLSGRLKRGI